MFITFWTVLFGVRMLHAQVLDQGHDESILTTCVSAVEAFFPCPPTTLRIDHVCLCEQYLWRTACYENHLSTTPSCPDHLITETHMDNYCRAAGSVGATMVQQKRQLHARQIESLLSSIGGVVTSFLSSQTVVPIPTIPRIPSAPASTTTPANTPSASATSRQTVRSQSGSSTFATSTTSSASQTDASTSSPASTSSSESTPSPGSTKSGPSTGIIVGAVVGGVAVLALIGILIMLILRHRHKKAKHTKPALAASRHDNGTSAMSSPQSAHQVLPTTQHQYLNEKAQHEQQPQVWASKGNEMPTSANVWEIDGRQQTVPSELDAGPIDRHKPVGTAPHLQTTSEAQRKNDELFLNG